MLNNLFCICCYLQTYIYRNQFLNSELCVGETNFRKGRGNPNVQDLFIVPTFDGSEIRRENQLRLVVYPILFRGFGTHPRCCRISSNSMWEEHPFSTSESITGQILETIDCRLVTANGGDCKGILPKCPEFRLRNYAFPQIYVFERNSSVECWNKTTYFQASTKFGPIQYFSSQEDTSSIFLAFLACCSLAIFVQSCTCISKRCHPFERVISHDQKQNSFLNPISEFGLDVFFSETSHDFILNERVQGGPVAVINGGLQPLQVGL